jgi:hypothetical protein
MDLNGLKPIDLALHGAAEQQRRQQELGQKLKDAIEHPHTIERITLAAFAVRSEDGEKIMSVATPDGKRRDYPINAVVEQTLRLALFPPQAEAA